MEKRKIKVCVSGIHYPLSMMTYFIRALLRREDVDLVTAGPFTGAYTPWKGGMNLPTRYIYHPTVPLPQSFIGSKVDPKTVESQLPWIPDVWIQVDAGWHFSSRPNAGIVVHVQTDPHVLQSSYQFPRSYSDVNFCMQTPYMSQGDKYLPYAFDPYLHCSDDTVEKVYDGCLVGLQYEHRNDLIGRIRSRGYNVFYDTGPAFEEYRHLYNQSRVAISWSSMEDMPARVWEAMGMRIPLLTNIMPDLGNFFVEHDHYLGFSSAEEGADMFSWLINHPDEAEEMAERAYRKVTAGHTWDHRISQILETCKLI